MGTAISSITADVQTLGTRTIIGSFVCIIAILLFYNLLSSNRNIKGPVFLTVAGVVFFGSLILFTLAVDSIINNGASL